MAGVLPLLPKFQFNDASGVPLSGGSVDVYVAGTTERVDTWQDRAQTTLNTNPISLDANGSCSIWCAPALNYKFVVKDLAGVVQPHLGGDNILVGGETPTISVLAVDRFSGTGAQTQFTLSVTPMSKNNTLVYVGGVYIQKNAYSLTGDVVTFSAAPASGTDNIEVQTINLTDYTSVSTIVAAVTDNIANINTVAGIAADVTAVAGVEADVSAVADIAANIATVAGIASDVTTVAGVAANVASVVSNATDISTVATNLDALAAAIEVLDAAEPGYSLLALTSGEDDVLAFDVAETDTDYEARKVVAGAATNGSLTALGGSGIVWGLKIVTKEDGSLGWNVHNLFRATADIAADTTRWPRGNLTVTAGQTDSEGGTSAFLLTVSGTAGPNIRQAVTTNRENWTTYEVIVKLGTGATRCYVDLYDGTTHRYAYFDLSGVATGTVDANLTASISATRADGTALPSGFMRLKVSIRHSATSTTCYIGPCNADGSTTSTIGHTLVIDRPTLHYGTAAMDYLENTSTTAAVNGPPYDYSTGERRLYLEPTTTYVNHYSEDLTQADWVKSNITAAFNATGPSGSMCSTLTATANDGTCLQTVAGGTARVANFFVRRKTGTGTVSITIDNGATWEDITADINSTTYERFALAGGAGSVFGYKLGTSGDEIEVAYNLLFNHPQATVGAVMFRAPRAVWSSSSTHATVGDQFKINSGFFSAGYADGFSVYVDYDRPPGYSGWADYVPVSGSKTGYGEFTRYTMNSTDGRWLTTTSVGTRATYLYYPSAGERMEITLSSDVTEGRSAISINGEPVATHGSSDSTLGVPVILGTPTVDFVELAGLQLSTPGHSMFVRRLVVTPTPLDPRDVRTWRWSGSQEKRWLAMHEAFIAAELPNTKAQRAPYVEIISDDGDEVRFAVFCFQRYIQADYHNEMPGRLMQRNYRYTYSTGEMVPLTAPSVMYQDPRWSSGLGHSQEPIVFRVPEGTYEGEWRCVFTNQDSTSGTLTGDNRSLYTMINRRSDCHPSGWTTPVKLLDANAAVGGYGGAYLIGLDVIVLPADHATAPGRACIPLYDAGNDDCRVLYTDDYGGADGTNWTLGPSNPSPAYSGSDNLINEANCSFWPDDNGTAGTVIYTFRTWNASPQNERVWATSTDGINLTFQGLIPSYEGAECHGGAAQLDPDGSQTGTDYGKIVLCRPEYISSGDKTRQSARFSFFTDATMTPADEFYLFSSNSDAYRNRPFGYSSIRLTSLVDSDGAGGPICIYTVEGPSNGGQNDAIIYVMALPMPAF